MQPQERVIEYYKQANGKSPFTEWLDALPNRKTQAVILQRIDRVRLGNFGDCRNLGAGVYELRIFWGPGFRIYYGLKGFRIVLLLCGGDKSSQKKDIERARQLWKESQKDALEKL